MFNAENNSPVLSVVVTVVEGGATLERCLKGLTDQKPSISMEVLVPYDHITPEVKDFSDSFPDFNFIDLGEVLDGTIPANALEKHSFFDTRRTGALKIASGNLIAILEDRGVPHPEWADNMVKLHKQYPYAAIGGAIENGVDKPLNWAVYICDFGRYQPPFIENEPEYLSDTNICYKKKSLEGVFSLWETKYDEARVNWALRKKGEILMLSDLPRTIQIRESMSIIDMIRERFHWGRNFGRTRSGELKPKMRMLLLLAVPLLPIVLFMRHFRRQLSKKRNVKEFILATPALLVFLICWSVGEGIGYYEGPSTQ